MTLISKLQKISITTTTTTTTTRLYNLQRALAFVESKMIRNIARYSSRLYIFVSHRLSCNKLKIYKYAF